VIKECERKRRGEVERQKKEEESLMGIKVSKSVAAEKSHHPQVWFKKYGG